jgi:ATP-dependent DNA helicase RecG
VESWGRGIEKMVEACKDDGIPSPQYDVSKGAVTVTFKTVESRVVRNAPKGGALNGVITGALDATLDERQQAVLKEILKDPRLTTKQLSENTAMSYRTVRRVIGQLKDARILFSAGSKKSGHWQVADAQDHDRPHADGHSQVEPDS